MAALPRGVELKNKERVGIRPLRETDLQAVFDLSQSHLSSNKVSYSDFKTLMKRTLEGKDVLALVAHNRKGEPVGFALGRPLESVKHDNLPQQEKINFLNANPEKNIFFLNGAIVHPSYQNLGLAQHFTKWREEHAKELGYTHLLTTTVHPAVEHIADKGGFGKHVYQEPGGSKYFLKKLKET